MPDKYFSSPVILGAPDAPDLESQLECWGILKKPVRLIRGPWNTLIIKAPNQEVALGPAFARRLIIETI
ncbi:MAG: hypothetical protein SFT81_04270 [Candidatus Caenarcaniphilales bacterium]|nr:hypothetical protein [Candidatus Caenarcaniphilales bacterium]